ncbi:uncharacterized protein LOC129567405 isoform X2 [Sitodiplosis mosellana]|uniref:uncharacterized protein LOC129567405 isoform X2 n=1 Tax=Sitodiplosis mosellana TaxID=263140 RepID=UPI002443D741|nr:uncharacterized protein LOC129567405 isoform X2 [Sitodiplosis mosellana]
MLIGLVRDSVLQCFCHTCRVPGLPAAGGIRAMSAKTLRTKQPKMSNRQKFISTEIRCQEKSKGGLCYEVILGQPVAIPKQIKSAPATKIVSAAEIERKLSEAEKRRLELEAKRSADWLAKKNRIEEASRKKIEMDKVFANHARESLNAKMDNYGENREAIMADMKDKLKSQFQEIEKTRSSMEQQKSIERVAIDKKLKTAAEMRDENIKKMLERLKEHDRHAEIVRQKALSGKSEQNEPVAVACG